MDRLGRNEFIGEVRVALKKLKEGESKRYNMGLERIAQVNLCTCTHIENGFSVHITAYIEKCLDAALYCVLDIHLQALYAINVMSFSPCLIAEQGKQQSNNGAGRGRGGGNSIIIIIIANLYMAVFHLNMTLPLSPHVMCSLIFHHIQTFIIRSLIVCLNQYRRLKGVA